MALADERRNLPGRRQCFLPAEGDRAPLSVVWDGSTVGHPSKRPRTVALVVGCLDRGGAERIVVEIANRLPRNRYWPLVVTTRREGEMAGELAGDVGLVTLTRESGRLVASCRELGALLHEKGVDLVHSHNHHASYFTRLARKLCGGSWVHVVHDHHGPAVASRKLAVLDWLFLRDVSFYIATSAALERRAREVIGIPEERVRLVHNGVALPKSGGRRPASPPIIVQVGRLNDVKNPLLAVEAAAVLAGWGIDCRWLFVGAEDDETTVVGVKDAIARHGLEDSMVFAGEVPNVSELLASAAVGVLTSRFEGLSIAVLEYMAAGLPVVLTEIGETSNIIRRAGGGYVVPQGDAEGLAERLARVLRDPVLAQAMAEKNRKYVERYHSIESMLSEVVGIYDSLLGGGSRDGGRASEDALPVSRRTRPGRRTPHPADDRRFS